MGAQHSSDTDGGSSPSSSPAEGRRLNEEGHGSDATAERGTMGQAEGGADDGVALQRLDDVVARAGAVVLRAVRREDVSAVTQQLDAVRTTAQAVSILSWQDGKGRTALHVAAGLEDDGAMTRLLLSRGALPNVADKRGWLPLHVASMRATGANAMAALLSQPGTRVDAVTQDGNTVLHYWARAYRTPDAKALLDALLRKGAPLDATNGNGETALHAAVWRNAPVTLSLLLHAGADATLRDQHGQSSLHWAARLGHADLVTLLVPHSDLEARCSQGRTPEDWARVQGYAACARGLAEATAARQRHRWLTEWLAGLGLSRYMSHFEAEEFGAESVLHLTDPVLRSMNIPTGVRLTLLNDVASRRAHLAAKQGFSAWPPQSEEGTSDGDSGGGPGSEARGQPLPVQQRPQHAHPRSSPHQHHHHRKHAPHYTYPGHVPPSHSHNTSRMRPSGDPDASSSPGTPSVAPLFSSNSDVYDPDALGTTTEEDESSVGGGSTLVLTKSGRALAVSATSPFAGSDAGAALVPLTSETSKDAPGPWLPPLRPLSASEGVPRPAGDRSHHARSVSHGGGMPFGGGRERLFCSLEEEYETTVGVPSAQQSPSQPPPSQSHRRTCSHGHVVLSSGGFASSDGDDYATSLGPFGAGMPSHGNAGSSGGSPASSTGMRHRSMEYDDFAQSTAALGAADTSSTDRASESADDESTDDVNASLLLAMQAQSVPIIDARKLRFRHIIGKGFFSEVRLAVWNSVNVAVKTITFDHIRTKSSRQVFTKEVAIISQLRHPNILQFLGVCIQESSYSIVCEYMTKGTLHSVIRSGHFDNFSESYYETAISICRGMLYLHAFEPTPILHRDLTSKNVLLDDRMNAKVADFGVSRELNVDYWTRPVGALPYVAPEVYLCNSYSTKSDVYSFGVILWEMITQRDPNGTLKAQDMAQRVAKEGYRPNLPSTEERAALPWPGELYSLFQRCWAQDPEERPSFRAILPQLEQLFMVETSGYVYTRDGM